MSIPKDAEGKLLEQILTAKGGSQPVIDSYNYFIIHQIPNILASKKVQIVSKPGLYVTFANPFFTRPSINDLQGNGTQRKLFPYEARMKGLSYMASLYAEVQISRYIDGQYVPISGESTNALIGKVPVMLHSEIDHLSGMTQKERYAHGEPEKDPGGYFINKGSEKILMNIEKLRTLVPYLYEDKGKFTVRYTSQTLLDSTVVIVKEDQETINVTFTKMGIGANSINIFYIFRILGLENPVESAIQIMETFIVDDDPQREARRKKELRQYIQNTVNAFYVQTQGDINRLMGILAKKFKDPEIINSPNRDANLVALVRTEIFKNIPMGTEAEQTSALMAKIRLLSSMVVKYVDFKNGYREPDDRDSWAHKRLVDAGEHMNVRFTKLWLKMVNDIQNDVIKKNLSNVNDIKNSIRHNYMTEQFISSFAKGLWGGQGTNREIVIVDTLKRDTLLAAHAHIRRVSTPTNRRAKIREKRLIHNTQWGALCPTMTPEGEACGLVKDSALTVFISLDRDPSIVRSRINGLYTVSQTPESRQSVYLNGVHLGYANTKNLYLQLRDLRRSQQLYFDTGIVLDQYNDLWIMTNSGRICRPLLIVDPESQELVIDRKGLRGQNLQTLMKNQALEYIDIAEQQQINILIAVSVGDLVQKKERLQTAREQFAKMSENPGYSPDQIRTREKQLQTATEELELLLATPNPPANECQQGQVRVDQLTMEINKMKSNPGYSPEQIETARRNLNEIQNEIPYTHAEVDPTAILGISASIIPLPEFMPNPRGAYQSAMGKQALGPNSSRIELRYDTSIKTLTDPSVPYFATDAHEWLGLDEYPAGRSAIVAITADVFTEEDAIVFNKSALERNMYTLTIFHSYKETICQSANRHEEFQIPEYPESQAHKYAKLDPETAIVKIGQYVERGDCLVGKVIRDNNTGKVTNASLYVEIGKRGIVEDVFITENAESCKLVRIRLRETRTPKSGDKFASRYAQKGVIGQVIPEKNMPQIISDNPRLNGLRPHIIFNPHGIPSRMTIGKLIEMTVGRYALEMGERINSTAFRRFNYQTYVDTLESLGYSRSGKEKMINGVTGREMDVEIFVGPVYYQVLRHLVDDKVQARGTGQVQFLTRQPISGIRKEGGLRFGHVTLPMWMVKHLQVFSVEGNTSKIRETLDASLKTKLKVHSTKLVRETHQWLRGKLEGKVITYGLETILSKVPKSVMIGHGKCATTGRLWGRNDGFIRPDLP